MFTHQRSLALLALLAFLAAPAACATIIHGTNEEVAIHSTPDSAAVTVDDVPLGHTPVTFKMSRKSDHKVKLELAGYEPVTMPVTRKVSGWFFGNILIGGLVGIAVDAISGGMYDLSPDQVQAALTKNGVAARAEHDGLYVLVVMHADPSWKRIGTLQASR